MIIKGREVLLKRLPVSVDRSEKIQKYDLDNRYPQRAKETMYRSYTLSGVLPKLSGFLNGEGFVDPLKNDIVVYTDGFETITLRGLLDMGVTYDMSWLDSYALHINYNLNYTISSITPIPVEYIRLGLPDQDGCVHEVGYSTNWERDYYKEDRNRVIEYYPLFNPFKVREQVEMAGGIEKYKGQIFYSTPIKDQYPKATFDSVWEQAQTQAEISLFSLYNSVNGFTASHIFLYPGKFEDDTERNNFKKRLQEHKGPQGANSMMIIEAGTADVRGSDFLVKTDLPNNDKMFEFTLNWCEKAILQNYAAPMEIVGKSPDTGMFNKQQIEDAYTYFNATTRDKRDRIARELRFLFNFWHTPIEGNFEIMPQVYEKAKANLGTPKIDPNTSMLPTVTQQGQNNFSLNSIQSEIDRIMRSLSRRDVSKIYSYVNDYKNGRATIEQTKAFLKPFLQTEENINLFIQDPEGDG